MTQPVWEAEPQAGMWRNVPPTARPSRDLHVAPQQNGGHHAPSETRRRIDLGLEQLDEHGRALRVPDEDDRPAVVVVGEVVLPGGEQAAVRDGQRRLRRLRQTGHRDLAVHGGPHGAALGEAGRLDDGGRPLGGLHRQVGVDAWLRRDRRVDVEAVEAARRGRGRGEGGAASPLGRSRPWRPDWWCTDPPLWSGLHSQTVLDAAPERERGRSRTGRSRRQRAGNEPPRPGTPARHACATRPLMTSNHRRACSGRSGPERRAEEHGASA